MSGNIARDLMDSDGENRAVRAFIAMYEMQNSITAGGMHNHLKLCGFDVAPEWAITNPKAHLTKAGAQLWLRMLFDLEKPPKDPELDALRQSNTWNHLRDFVQVWNKMQKGEWQWFANPQCKYVGLRIDMRDGGCLIFDRDGNRITPEQLSHQHGAEK